MFTTYMTTHAHKIPMRMRKMPEVAAPELRQKSLLSYTEISEKTLEIPRDFKSRTLFLGVADPSAKADLDYINTKPTHRPATPTKPIRWAACNAERLSYKVNVRRLETSDKNINCRTALFSCSLVHAPNHWQKLQVGLSFYCMYTTSEASPCLHAVTN